jgi:hypothetical protein
MNDIASVAEAVRETATTVGMLGERATEISGIAQIIRDSPALTYLPKSFPLEPTLSPRRDG